MSVLQKGEVSPGVGKEGSGDFKAKKAEAAKRFKENKAKKAKALYDNSLKLRDELTKAGILDRLTAETKAFVLGLCVDPATKVKAASGGGNNTFNVLFGANPAVGQKISLGDIFEKTFKGKATVDLLVKRWAEKGIVVECAIDQNKMVNTTYTITKLPAAI